MKDQSRTLSPLTIALHWLVGLTIIGLVAVGIYMEENEVLALYPIHKSVGVLILAVALARAVWRLINGWPKPVSQYKQWEHRLAKLIHWILIIATLLFPVSGMMMSGGGGYGVPLFGLELIAPNPDPLNPAKMLPLNETVASLGHSIHGLLGNVVIVAILLHLAGALKHHIFDKDQTLRRMLGLAERG